MVVVTHVGKHVVHKRHWRFLLDAHAYANKVASSNHLDDVAHAVVCAGRAFLADTDVAHGYVDVVVHNNQVSLFNLVLVAQLLYCLARKIHVGNGLCNDDLFRTNACVRSYRFALPFVECYAKFLCKFVHTHKTHIVECI